MPKRFPLLLCLLALAGCTRPRGEAEKLLFKIGPTHVREAAARVYKDAFAAHPSPDYSTVPEKTWPPEIKAFAPEHVGAYRDGVAIAVISNHDSESGIYVIPAYTSFVPRQRHNAHYEPLADGVFWYSFAR